MSGTKSGKAKTGKNRWGPGNVHYLHYDRLNRLWYIQCRGVARGNQFATQWARTDDSAEVTCKNCLKGMAP